MYRSVLCLFDSEEATETLKATFGPGCRILVVTTVLAALQELRKFTPDMIVVQVGLQDESCFDFFKAVQSLISSKKIPMVAVCASDMFHESIESFIRKSCHFFGCHCYLSHSEFHSNALRFMLTQKLRERNFSKAC